MDCGYNETLPRKSVNFNVPNFKEFKVVLYDKFTVVVKCQDITYDKVEAITNAANSYLAVSSHTLNLLIAWRWPCCSNCEEGRISHCLRVKDLDRKLYRS